MDIECHTHIEEYAHQNGHNAHRRQKHILGVCAHQQGDDGRDEDDDEEGKSHLLDVVEHRMTYVFQEHIERHESDDAQQRLTDVVDQAVVVGHLAVRLLLLE